jgi:hypothetical protein
MADHRSGAAAPLRREEAHCLAHALRPAIAPAAALRRAPLERFAQRIPQRRVEVLVDARAQRRKNGGWIGRRIERDDHRVAGNRADRRHQALERFPPPADVHQNHVRPHPLQPVEEIADIAHVLMLDDDAERQLVQAGLGLLPQLAILDRQADG